MAVRQNRFLDVQGFQIVGSLKRHKYRHALFAGGFQQLFDFRFQRRGRKQCRRFVHNQQRRLAALRVLFNLFEQVKEQRRRRIRVVFHVVQSEHVQPAFRHVQRVFFPVEQFGVQSAAFHPLFQLVLKRAVRSQFRRVQIHSAIEARLFQHFGHEYPNVLLFRFRFRVCQDLHKQIQRRFFSRFAVERVQADFPALTDLMIRSADQVREHRHAVVAVEHKHGQVGIRCQSLRDQMQNQHRFARTGRREHGAMRRSLILRRRVERESERIAGGNARKPADRTFAPIAPRQARFRPRHRA